MKAKHTYCVIMAGGIGSRFWPLSRVEKPKQFIDALGIGKTFIQLTYERFSSFIPDANFLVLTGTAYKDLVLEQLPMLKASQILCEPMRRNTAPCIAYATYKLRSIDPEAMMIVSPSDQYIGDNETFASVINDSLSFASQHDTLMTIGITPNYPATGYGYIQMGDKKSQTSRRDIFKVAAFTEKPELEKAKDFLKSGDFVWNSGMFIWNIKTICKNLTQHLPDIAQLFDTISASYNTAEEQDAVNCAFEASRSISIDYGVMEQATDVSVCPAEFGWNDLGSWGALYNQLDKDPNGNVIAVKDILISDSHDSLIKSTNTDKRLIVDGVDDLLIVDTEDILLICPRKDENRVKEVISKAGK